MTNEEAIRIAQGLITDFKESETMVDFCNTVMEALERTSALDKIRAEIEQVAFKDVNGSKYIFVNRVNQITGSI